jgi:putative membrane protein
MNTLMTNIVSAGSFALLGVLLFAAAFWLVEKLTPGSLWKELLEDQNTAVGVLMGCVVLGLAIIVAAAIH